MTQVLLVLAGVLIGLGAAVLPVLEVFRRLLPRLGVDSVRGLGVLLWRDVRPASATDPRRFERRIAGRMRRERMTFSSGANYAMASISVALAPVDHAALLSVVPESLLTANLEEFYLGEARRQGWRMPANGAVGIAIVVDARLPRGAIAVSGALGAAYDAPPKPAGAGVQRGGAVTSPDFRAPASTEPRDVATPVPTDRTMPYPIDRTTPYSIDPAATTSIDGQEATTTPFHPARCTATLSRATGVTVVQANAGPATLGRDPGATVQFDEPGVSRTHATLRHSPNGWVLIPDRSAKNGTFVAGRRIDGPAHVRGRVELGLGRNARADFMTDCIHSMGR